MPALKPLVLRFHLTLPLPVPLAVVSVVHAFFLVALHAVLRAVVETVHDWRG